MMTVPAIMMPRILAPVPEGSGRMPVAVRMAVTVIGRPSIPRGPITTGGVVMVYVPAIAVIVIDMAAIGVVVIDMPAPIIGVMRQDRRSKDEGCREDDS